MAEVSREIALIWLSPDCIDNKLTLVQVMAWCHQASSHYLSQCWPKSMSPYDITKPQWVNCSALTNTSLIKVMNRQQTTIETKDKPIQKYTKRNYKTTAGLYDLSRQVVFHYRENKHDFVKTMPVKCQTLCFFIKTSLVSLDRELFH